MESPKPENKSYIFPIVLALFLLALLFRLIKAETIPFTRADADLAWQAMEISKLQSSGTSPLALYTGLTGFLFWITSNNNLFARLFPALFGASLIFVPYLLLDKNHPKSLFGLSLLLALDPVLLTYSRQLNGPIMAISTLTWTLVFLHKKKPTIAGIAFGMAVMSGKYFWLAALLVGIYLLVVYLLDRARFYEIVRLFGKPTASCLISVLLSCVLIPTSFLLNPSGLTGIASGLVDVFAVSKTNPLPLLLPIFLMSTYGLFLLLPFGKVLRNSTSHSRYINLGFLFGLLLFVVFFQNQFPGLYAFIELFLILIITCNMEVFTTYRPKKIALVGLIAFIFFVVILMFTLLSFTHLTRLILEEINFITDFLPILLALALILISYLLIGLGWGFDQTKPALEAAIIVITVFLSLGFSLSQTWSDATTSQLLFTNSEILFPDRPINNELAVFIKNKAINASVDSYKIENLSSVGENWEFKEFYDSTKTSSLPAFILNDSVTESGMMTPYRGTTIVAARRLNLSDKAYAELLNMISSKTLPVSNITRTLWVQTALFLGGK